MKSLINLIFLVASMLFLLPLESAGQMMIPVFTEPSKLEDLSSEAEESMPLSFNAGKGFYFHRIYVKGEGVNTQILGGDIWIAEMNNDEEWERPYRLFREGYLKGEGNIFGTSEDGSRIYIFITTYSKEGSTSKIGYMEKTGKNKWSDLTEIEIKGLVFEERFYGFYMSSNEEVLLVSMSPSESHMDEDLFVSLKEGENKYGQLINLGEKINTQKAETYPYIGDDGKTLYFASYGHKGLGEADIFTSRRLDDSWTNWTRPLNLGAPINSEGVEGSFTIGNNKEVFFCSDREMQHTGIFKAKFTGEFKFAYSDSVNGQFFFKGLPADSASLEIYDLDGNLVDAVVTDAYGRFTYRKLHPDDVYMIKMREEDADDFTGSIIYIADEQGKRSERLIFTDLGEFVHEDEIELVERELIQGKFNYNSLPQKKVALVLYDENGFAVDTIFTDEEGKFDYQKLKYDKEFTIVPLEAVDQTDALDIFLTNEAGKKILQLISTKNRFSFVPIEKALAMSDPKTSTEAQAESTMKTQSGSSVNVSGWAGLSTSQKTVYFEFAQNELNEKEKAKLDLIMKLLKNNSSLKVILTGHTDNIGTMENNEARGLQRANAVKNYLVTNGLSNTIIQNVDSKGEIEPISSNEYERGRAKNRRVEISLSN